MSSVVEYLPARFVILIFAHFYNFVISAGGRQTQLIEKVLYGEHGTL